MPDKDSEKTITWLVDVEKHDYTAAHSYLSLIYAKTDVDQMVAELQDSVIVEFAAKDIFRASQLDLLNEHNSHVQSNWRKIKDKKKLSPLLLTRDTQNGKVVIADGYHRLCAVYSIDEDAQIPCKIV